MGPRVTSQTPLVVLVISAPCPTPGMSLPLSRTASAFEAWTRNVILQLPATAGETTRGPCGPDPGRTGCANPCESDMTAVNRTVARSDRRAIQVFIIRAAQ